MCIQWGTYKKASGATISFPLTAQFTQIPIVIAHLTEYTTVHSTIGYITTSGFRTKASQYGTSQESRDGNYIAIGY